MVDFLNKKRRKSSKNEDSKSLTENENFKNKLKNTFKYNENYIFSRIIFEYFSKKINFKDLLDVFQGKTSETIKSHINKTKHIYKDYYSEILNENIKKVKGLAFEYLINEYIENNAKILNSKSTKPFNATSGEAKYIINNLAKKDESYQKLNGTNYSNDSIFKTTIENDCFDSVTNIKNLRVESNNICDSSQQSINSINKKTYLMKEKVIEFKNDTIKCNINSNFFIQTMNLVKNHRKIKDNTKIFLTEKNKEICFQNMLLNDYMGKMNNFYAIKNTENNHNIK